LYSIKRTTGIVVDFGDSVSHIVPIFECSPLPDAIMQLTLGGRDLTAWMQKILNERDYVFRTSD
jgi:actin